MPAAPRQAERRIAILEVTFWLLTVSAVVGVAAYVGLRARHDDDLTPEQQAYVRAVATQQALTYIEAVATQQASMPLADTAAAPAPAPRAVVAAPTAPIAAPPAQSRPEPPAPPSAAPSQASPTPVPPPPLPAPAVAPPPPPPPPPPATVSLPPGAACVGFMNGNTSTGEDACRQIIADPATNHDVALCIGDVLAGTQLTQDGKHDCTQAALHTRDAFLQDCFLGLAGLSHFGRRACTQYYNRYAHPS
jgi:hypothetical protein